MFRCGISWYRGRTILGAAARTYLLKERVGDAAQLRRAIQTVATNGTYLDPLVVEALVQTGPARQHHR